MAASEANGGIRIVQKNGSGQVSADDDAKVNYVLFGTCIFGGIGTAMKVALSSTSGKMSIGTGMACIGGRLISIDSEETVDGTSGEILFIIDLREAGKENAYLARSYDGIEGIENGAGIFLESGKIYFVLFRSSDGIVQIPTRDPGEASSARMLSASGYLGKTKIGDLFTFNSDSTVSDFKQVQHCAYADIANYLLVGGKDKYKIDKGLSLSFGGRLLVYAPLTVSGAFNIPTTASSSDVSIRTDTSATKQKETSNILSQFDSIYYVWIAAADDSGVEGCAGNVREDSSVIFFQGLEMAFSFSSDGWTIYTRWKKGTSPKELADVKLFVVGTAA